jgi:hypothetical protein
LALEKKICSKKYRRAKYESQIIELRLIKKCLLEDFSMLNQPVELKDRQARLVCPLVEA